MASELPSMSKTDKNLWSAIVAEAMAYLKYNAYAHKALEEGHPEVAQVGVERLRPGDAGKAEYARW